MLCAAGDRERSSGTSHCSSRTSTTCRWKIDGTSVSTLQVREPPSIHRHGMDCSSRLLALAGNRFFYNPVTHLLSFTVPPNIAVCVECDKRFAEARMPEGAFCHQCMAEWDVPKHYVAITGWVESVDNVEPLDESVRFRHAAFVTTVVIRSAHHRVQEFAAVTILEPPPPCVECEDAAAVVWCEECEDAFCDGCAATFHQYGKAAYVPGGASFLARGIASHARGVVGCDVDTTHKCLGMTTATQPGKFAATHDEKRSRSKRGCSNGKLSRRRHWRIAKQRKLQPMLIRPK